MRDLGFSSAGRFARFFSGCILHGPGPGPIVTAVRALVFAAPFPRRPAGGAEILLCAFVGPEGIRSGGTRQHVQ